jgi:hypothetical protein
MDWNDWNQLKAMLTASNGTKHITIYFATGPRAPRTRMLLEIVVRNFQIDAIDNMNTNGNVNDYIHCISIDMRHLESSSIQFTETCTIPPLEENGNLDLLTNIKEQLIVGLSNLDFVKMFDVATIGETLLTPFKLVRSGTTAYSKHGYYPVYWGEGDLAIFKDKLADATINELSIALKNEIFDKLSIEDLYNLKLTYYGDDFNEDNIQEDTIDSEFFRESNVRDVMGYIGMYDDILTSEHVCEELLDILIDNEEVDEDLLIGDPNDDESSIYNQGKNINRQNPNFFNQYRYRITGYDNNDRENSNNEEDPNANLGGGYRKRTQKRKRMHIKAKTQKRRIQKLRLLKSRRRSRK